MSLRSRLTCLSLRGRIKMSIDARCQEQLRVADQMFMDFKYTRPGSNAQLRALNTLSFLVSMWSDFLSNEERRMDAAITLETQS